MSDSAKVVRLRPAAPRGSHSRMERLPAIAQALLDHGKSSLQQSLQSFFDATDDALFDLADRAETNQDQNVYFDSMREVRVQRQGLESRFMEEIELAFERALMPGERADARTDGELSAEALSLVQNDELEQLVAVESAVRRANVEFSSSLTRLCKGFSTIALIPIRFENLPLGPEILCNALMVQIKRLDIDIKARLLMFKLFDRHVLRTLIKFYDELLQVFADHGIHPAADRRDSGASDVNEPKPEKIAAQRGQSVPDLASQPKTSERELLLKLLSSMQTLPVGAGNQRGLDFEHLLEKIQRQRGQAFNVSPVEQETMRLVQMLFEFMLRENSLTPPIKEQLSRLQVPLLKVALLDESFLTDQRHVARRLINEISTLAIGCAGSGQQDASLLQFLQETVERIINEFDNNANIFTETLDDLTTYVEKEKRRATILERRTIDAEDGKARVELTRSRVAQEIDQKTASIELPKIVRSLIYGPWSNVLFVTGLKHGFVSEEWAENMNVLSDLIWSIQPRASAEERQRLIRMIPALMQNLKKGLDAVSYNPFEVSELFSGLEEIHLARIRGESLSGSRVALPSVAPQEPPKVQSAAPVASPAPIASAEALLATDPHMQTVSEFAPGSWFDLNNEDGSVLRCRLAATIKATGKYIFVNRSGMKVAEKTQQDLAFALKAGNLKIIDNSMLFDRALESIVSGMRKCNRRPPDIDGTT